MSASKRLLVSTQDSFSTSCVFLTVDPELWASRDDYNRGCITVNSLSVTNDNAERGVALVHKLNKLITHDMDQFQFLLQPSSKLC